MLFTRGQTLLIALALLIPESLHRWHKTLEPYPAVILPAGAGRIQIHRHRVRANRPVVLARREGSWQEVNAVKLMYPVGDYFTLIAKRNFGFPRSKDPSPEELADAAITRNWMQTRLAGQGFETKQIRVVNEELTIELPTGKVVSTRPTKKKTYDLD